ncbi:hypothetical protein ACJQWK_08568 [Exserohilum turcicum]|uniref:Beta-lactamase-related domain-containing protein n=1 Tax=Exserohilum turcicum (strain 28A) TaxID=671987 RepID=R0IS48_EXST2|nr:uncharacterized protein SETTUDRAFT_109485 [Exserohilum turcica Et28A]EOA87655.1 hypothetical protein SETTUDRAFT_109485 [Exserohilum turcica Et28A]
MYTSRSLFSTLANCLSLATLVAAVPATNHHLTVSKRNAKIEQSVFFNINGTEAEIRIAKLKAEGYRPSSLNVHGSPPDAKYAGIWTKQDGSRYETIVGANETAYNAWLAQWKTSGYVSTHVSATGPASNAVFAGVMEQTSSVGNWTQTCSLDDPYIYVNTTDGTPMTIKGVSMYGVEGERKYCILGHEDTNNHIQTVWYQKDKLRYDFDMLLSSETSKRFWRLVFVDSSEDQILTPIFDSTSVGQWTVRTNLTTLQLKTEMAAQKAKNMYPTHISGAGSAEARYAVIFAERLTPLEREWHVTGTVGGFQDNDGIRDTLDQVMQDFMKRNSVRQAQVAVSINGTVVTSRGYTWAESNRAIVQPSDKFLLASVSKAFTYTAVDHLISTGMLNLTTRVYPLLGYNNPKDARALNITVDQLLNHTAGFDRSISPDIGFVFTLVGQSLNQATPATLRQVIEWVYDRPLDYTPGEKTVYSNYGTMLLSYVLTNLTGHTYKSYLEKHVLAGYDVELWETAADKHLNDAIVQETQYTGISALTPLAKNRVSNANGGDGGNKEEAMGAYGLKCSAATIARFFSTHAAYSTGGHEPYASRDGTMAGARTIGYSLPTMDWALTLNTRDFVTDQAFWDLVYGGMLYNFARFPVVDSL